ncbi:16S rRNA (cytidine(1402)-2'-O)-methyltransferase [Actinocatenispora sera]|uniref:16S rRNA (cytidine(1402)-2'-O)-methyltransferase n=1 Tax=Actinocatenispora sera TaxID=390989 RepID=UPI0033FDA1B1
MHTRRDGAGLLVLAGAPLGNVADASERLRAALADADLVAAEDTRRVRRLAAELGITLPRVVSYFEGNEARRTPELLAELTGGTHLTLITDAGMPSVSDPGYRLVRAAIEADVPVTAVPGPSAVTTALAVSGLPSDRFCFEGFPPRKTTERRSRFAELAAERRTLVFFESPHRIADTLTDLAAAFGPDRPGALCRELTKTYEQVRRGGLGELSAGAADDPPRGEITLVVAGAPAAEPVVRDAAELAALVAERQATGMSRRDAVDAVAAEFGLPRREVYAAALGTR